MDSGRSKATGHEVVDGESRNGFPPELDEDLRDAADDFEDALIAEMTQAGRLVVWED